MTEELFKTLLLGGENETVDFKVVGYFSNKQDKKEKDAEFVKDILSLCNSIREQSAYIIIGVDNAGTRVGIAENSIVDNSILQAKIRDKAHPLPKFNSYQFRDVNGLLYQIIEIPVSWYSSPCIPTQTIGGILEKGQIYIRRDSANEKALYDDIIRLNSWLGTLSKQSTENTRAQRDARERGAFRFDEITIQRLFGNEAAEDEDTTRLHEYYFKNDTFDKIAVDLPLRILVGHKGIGKSALLNIAMMEDRDNGKIPIKIKPDDIADLGKRHDDFSETIRSWRQGLLQIVAKKTFQYFGLTKTTTFDFSDFSGDYLELLTEELETAKDDGLIRGKFISPFEKFLEKPVINIYIDDLDRGWEGTKSDITRISTLLNAVRDIINNGNRRLQFKISLRSDVYFLYRTSDESTDKTQSSVIWYRWTYHEILGLLVKRVRTYFNKDVDERLLRTSHQSDLAKNLTQIIEPIFSGIGKWENKAMYKVLISVIRKRPRDLVKLLTLAAREAENRKSNIITTKDLKAVFDEYSLDRIQDTINEYKSELPSIERLIFGMKPDRRMTKASESFYYTTGELLAKINRIRERGEFRFAGGRLADAKDLAAFLYKINFITATKVTENFIERKDFEENRYLVPKFEDFGYDWEVHMAFRWGLQPSNQEEIYSLL